MPRSYGLPLARHRNRQHTASGLIQASKLGDLPRWGSGRPRTFGIGTDDLHPSHPVPRGKA